MMIETPHIAETVAQDAAVIHLTTPREEIRAAVEPAIEEILGVVSAEGAAPAGPLFFHHLRLDPTRFDMEVGFPVAARVQESGRVKPSQLPGGRVARTIYHGPYEGLLGAWGEFMKWIDDQGCKTGPHIWERYLVGPESGSDASTWRTELNRPLVV